MCHRVFKGSLSLQHVSVAYIQPSLRGVNSHRKLEHCWYVHIVRVTVQHLMSIEYGRCFRSAYTVSAAHCGHQFLWSDPDEVYIARRILSHQWRPRFWRELFVPDCGGIYTTETCWNESEPLKSSCIAVGTYLVNNSLLLFPVTFILTTITPLPQRSVMQMRSYGVRVSPQEWYGTVALFLELVRTEFLIFIKFVLCTLSAIVRFLLTSLYGGKHKSIIDM